jgi:hypothetical protein
VTYRERQRLADIQAAMLNSQPSIPWSQIARMRDRLAHRYFDTNHALLQATVDNDLPELERAVQALATTLQPGPSGRRHTRAEVAERPRLAAISPGGETVQ